MQEHDHDHPHDEHGQSPDAHEDTHGHAEEAEHLHADAGHNAPHGRDDHDHQHDEGSSKLLGMLRELSPFGHGHSHAAANIDTVLESSERGIRALKLSLVILGATATLQLIIVAVSGSVALLTDTIHNFGDAFTAVPLWIAFTLARRPATRRYSYGYGRVEDAAGVLIVTVIFASAVFAGYESVRRLLHPQSIDHVGWVMAAAILGFVGNEAVAVFRIRVGRAIGSAALIADGQHARVDGLTSLAVLVGALGVLAGYPIADALVGLFMTVVILAVVREAAASVWRRLTDAVEPEMIEAVERAAEAAAGVAEVHDIRMRWLGHRLEAELHVSVDEELPTRESHRIAEDVRHALFHALPGLRAVNVHVDPDGPGSATAHDRTAHHAS